MLKSSIQQSHDRAYEVDTEDKLPFNGRALGVDAIVPLGKISTAANVAQFDLPYADVQQGANNDQINLRWSKDVKGKVSMTVRCDRTF